MSTHESETDHSRYAVHFLEMAGVVVWEFDWATAAFTYVSDAAESFLGFAREEWLEPGFWLSHVHPEDAEKAARFCKDSTQAGRDHDFEYRMIRKDGSVIHVRDMVTVDPDKRLDGLLHGLLINITEREQAKTELGMARDRYRSMLEESHLIAAEADVDGRIVYCNDAACDLTGLTRAQIEGHHFEEFVAEDAVEDLKRFQLDRIAGNSEYRTIEMPIVSADGGRRTVRFHTSVIFGADDTPTGLVVLGEDITPQITLEKQLGRAEQDFEVVFRLLRDLYFRLDSEGRFTYVLAPEEQRLVMAPEVLLGRPYAEVLPESAVAAIEPGIAAAHETGEPTVIEYGVALDGVEESWEARLLPLPDGGTAVVARDITRRIERDRALAESEERFRSLLDASPYSIVVADPHGRIIYGNPAAADLIGADSADVLTGVETAGLVVDPEDPGNLEAIRVMRETIECRPDDPLPVSESIRVKVRTLDGRIIDTERTVAGFRVDGQPNLLVMSRDTTAEVEAELAARESRARFQNVLESAPLGIVFMRLKSDQRIVVVDANPAAERLLHLASREYVGLELGDAFEGLAHSDIPAALRRIALVGGVWTRDNVDYADEQGDGVFDITAFQPAPSQVAIMLTDVSEKRAAMTKEVMYKSRLRAMASELTAAEDRERRHLAEELHDRVSQSLAVARMHLDAFASQHEHAEQVDRARSLLEDAIAETRTITTELAPPVLYELGLGPALRWACDKIEAAYGLHVTLEVDFNERGLDDERKMVLFRAGRELLMNVVKHSGALEADMSLYDLDELVVLTVEDMGRGFDPDSVESNDQGGFGLFSIKERLPHLGGTFSVISAANEGTTATLSVPHPRPGE